MLYRFYKIFSEIDDEICYIGKTTKKLNIRFYKHKSTFNNNHKYKYTECSKKVFEKYGIENTKIMLIKELDFENKKDADKKECDIMLENKNCINRCHPSKTSQDWRNENKNYAKNYNAEYYKNILSKKEWYCIDCNINIKEQVKNRHLQSISHFINLFKN